MRIDGRWLVCDDGVRRPVISGEIRAADGSWEKSEFLVDTGADRTVFSAATLARLAFQPSRHAREPERCGGHDCCGQRRNLDTPDA